MKRALSLGAIATFLFFTHYSWGFALPVSLANSQLSTVSNVLGFGTSNKFLSNPYPLGGYSGIEVGYGAEFIDVEDLTALGAGTSDQGGVEVDRISIGKGLYGNIDIFLNFLPFSGPTQISSYGTSLKWTMYEAQFIPFSLSGLLHYDSINFHDQFMSEDYGVDLIAGINVNHVALYFGGGPMRGRHSFSKNILDMTDAGNIQAVGSERSLVRFDSQTHTLIGLQTEISNFFLVGEIDRYANPVYCAKVGVRY